MPRALAKVGNRIIAETDSWQIVENNIYFPRSAIIDDSILQDSDRSTFCPWKGHASYWNLKVDGQTLENAAWYYREPYDAAADIKDHVAFYSDKVEISQEP
ncbi:hypothetical protein LT330_001037 [Penicillium expansum]|uniref:DUF427 domain-containing protein n=1 Tax=Penicillium expansum TaxID=27334 RepID=A0A0A2JCD2_PENEN|nr:Protein of unknown function DUF427 [Penicillium expansum]KAJ5501409.1 hypothetical protein N7453_006226 [Penicillium expansum]KAK4867527.1 hypothetical protein LT330_001037 [Penicillium expansum]KGO40894.1 Protein of unknown function DUF427 [Penicillium expansum]KGO53077.1 Protein of unknown function DUF427 [Penicillium expansum]